MPGANSSHRAQQIGPDVGNVLFQLVQQCLHPLPPGPFHAVTVARTTENRHAKHVSTFARQGLAYVHQRPDDRILFVVGDKVRAHPLDGTVEEEVQNEGLHEVVKMVSQGDLVPSFGCCIAVQNSPRNREQKAQGLVPSVSFSSTSCTMFPCMTRWGMPSRARRSSTDAVSKPSAPVCTVTAASSKVTGALIRSCSSA